jgi:hypothetical protein
MTTIAYDGKVLASDSLMTGYDIRRGHVEKIHRLSDGRMFALSGDYIHTDDVRNYLEGKRVDPPKGDYTVVLVQPDGQARLIKDGSTGVNVPHPLAIGSGDVIALTAMRCGMGAEHAVKIAIEMDVYSGGDVQVLRLQRKRKRA